MYTCAHLLRHMEIKQEFKFNRKQAHHTWHVDQHHPVTTNLQFQTWRNDLQSINKEYTKRDRTFTPWEKTIKHESSSTQKHKVYIKSNILTIAVHWIQPTVELELQRAPAVLVSQTKKNASNTSMREAQYKWGPTINTNQRPNPKP